MKTVVTFECVWGGGGGQLSGGKTYGYREGRFPKDKHRRGSSRKDRETIQIVGPFL